MRTTLTLLLSFFCCSFQAQNCSVLYVNANAAGANTGISWANAFTSLQGALIAASACPEGAEIWVAQGIYYPEPGQLSDSRDATFRLLNKVALYGGFAGTETARGQRDWAAHPTVLSGDIGLPGDSTDNCYTVVTAIDVDSTALLDGFVVRDGNANGDNEPGISVGPKNSGAGLYNQNSALRVSNCLFEKNIASSKGTIYNTGTLNMENCIIKGNFAGSGGGVHNAKALFMYNCLLAGNGGLLGGAIYNAADATLANCTISGNIASIAGALYQFNYSTRDIPSAIVFTNCIIWRNSGVFSSNQFYQSSFPPVPDNTIMHLVNSCYADSPGDNALFGLFTADANSITANPRFIAPLHPNAAPATGGDYRLDLCSPAIDAGDSSLLPPGLSEDLGFNPRIVGSAVDMGAYEVQEPQDVPVISPDATASPPSCFGRSDGSLALNVSGGAPPYSILWDTGQEGPAISGLAAGDYSATVTDASGCTGVGSFYLPEPGILEATIHEIQSASCSEASNGAAFVQAAGGTPPYQYLWENGQSGGAAGGLASGPHLVTVADANGCEAIITAGIPALPFEPDLFIEQEGNTLIVAEEDTAHYRFQWINCHTGEEIPGATGRRHIFRGGGVYRVIVTDSSGACNSTSQCMAVIVHRTVDASSPQQQARAFPNPTCGRFTLALPWAAEALLHDASGHLLLREHYGPGNHQVDMGKLPAGVYTIALKRPEGMQVFRLIRQ